MQQPCIPNRDAMEPKLTDGGHSLDAERRQERSHAERGNEKWSLASSDPAAAGRLRAPRIVAALSGFGL
jgi:hypothetical protein